MRKTPERRTRKRTPRNPIFNDTKKPPPFKDLATAHAKIAEYNGWLLSKNEALEEALKAAETKPRSDLLAIVTEAGDALRRAARALMDAQAALEAKEQPLSKVETDTRERLTQACLEVGTRGVHKL